MKPKIYPVTSSVVDLFFGEGWDNWTRVLLKREKNKVVSLEIIGGKSFLMPKLLLSLFQEKK